jgi:MFS family permease
LDQNLHIEKSPRRTRFTLPPALRYPMYRRFWLGSLASVAGFQMLMFAQGWLAYELTGSAAFLGTVWIASSASAILLNLFGGVYADRMDKRAVIIVTQTANAALILLLAVITLFELVQPWHLVAIGFVVGGVNAFDQPARQALYPHLIERKVMMSAVALNSSVWQGTRIAAPALAGIVVAVLNTHAAFFLGAAGFFTMALVMLVVRVPPIETRRGSSAAQDLVEGLRFVKDNSTFSILIGMTFFNSFFGMAYVVLMPIFARDILEVGAAGQGWLLSAGGVGALENNNKGKKEKN